MGPKGRTRQGVITAELLCAGWETFSALLFISAVAPAGYSTPWAATVFMVSLVVSALGIVPLSRRGAVGLSVAAGFRVVAWTVSVTPLLSLTDPRLTIAGTAFGLMAYFVRRAAYRRLLEAEPTPFAGLGRTLRYRLAEGAAAVGVVGGHVLLLFAVAFLRTASSDIFRAWLDVVPLLALLGTIGFTVAIGSLTRSITTALDAGPRAKPTTMQRALDDVHRLPNRLAALNFTLWLLCTAIGIFTLQLGQQFDFADAAMQLAFGALFAFGVSFYQRGWHRDVLRPVSRLLSKRLDQPPRERALPLRERMLRDFGLPIAFMATLSFLSAVALYRTLADDLPLQEDFNAISALFASFVMLVLAVGGVVVRASRELSRPLASLAESAEAVARGQLGGRVVEVIGPKEVVGLRQSVERMREALANTIAELSEERGKLEENVEARTSELRNTLDELKHAQAALVHGERLASIGELVAGVAHEIYNPLNAISGASEPLAQIASDMRRLLDAYRNVETQLPAAERQRLTALREELDIDTTLDDLAGISDVVRRATERSVRIVQNLRNFSRTSIEPAPSDLHEGLEETLLLLGPRLRQAEIEVVKDYEELPHVTCRAGEINQVFMNLLVNAIQAIESNKPSSQPGAQASRPPRSELLVTTRAVGAEVIVSVEDCGPGVPAAMASSIFDPFVTTKPKGEGTGLGLSIASDIVRRHGGELVLDEPVRLGGACFQCRLPIRPRISEEPPPASSRPSAKAAR